MWKRFCDRELKCNKSSYDENRTKNWISKQSQSMAAQTQLFQNALGLVSNYIEGTQA